MITIKNEVTKNRYDGHFMQNHVSQQFTLIFIVIMERNYSVDGKCKLTRNIDEKLPSALSTVSMTMLALRPI